MDTEAQTDAQTDAQTETQTDAQTETQAGGPFCPQCGSEEDGFFCRNCGTLLRGEDMVLCPRCHQVVPDSEYCNRCGQNLAGLALSLHQLATAGDSFWVTSEINAPPVPIKETVLEPDTSVRLAEPQLPDWLQELHTETAPAELGPRIYPALEPVGREREGASRNTSFLAVVIVSMLVLMIGLMFLVIFILLRGGA
jgi:hypothetical protein